MAMRMMDDLVDLELEKIDSIIKKIQDDPEEEKIKRAEMELWYNIQKKALQGRRTGLGITAEGDMLAALGLTYGADKAIDFSEKVHKTLKLEAYRSSVEMAKERGCFEIWNHEKEKNNPFLKRIKEEDPELYKEMVIHGRRNIALLTIAPTGTTSLMTRTTSGIEPVFKPIYKRRRKINPQEKDTKSDFTDKQGDAWQEYVVFHYNFELWLKINNYDIEAVKKMNESEIAEVVKKSPYYKATAHDVDWVKKVEMQGRIQKHVDHSISVTVNLPEEISEEVVSKVYEAGWKTGCKGITVYREGSREGVLISNSEKKQPASAEINAVKRPKVVNADVIQFQNNYEKWVAIIGKVAPEEGAEERPYELFTGKLDSFNIPLYVEKGQVIKRKEKNKSGEVSSIYDFKYIDKDGYPVEMAGLSRSFNKEYWNYAKLISGLLRQRMPIQYVASVVAGLKMDDADLNTWKNGVVRIINKYIKDGTQSKNTCEHCGAKLVYSEGCLKCEACGKFSRCG
jgi:ribonucleoside-diphosphate reductase alpha chain